MILFVIIIISAYEICVNFALIYQFLLSVGDSLTLLKIYRANELNIIIYYILLLNINFFLFFSENLDLKLGNMLLVVGGLPSLIWELCCRFVFHTPQMYHLAPYHARVPNTERKAKWKMAKIRDPTWWMSACVMA